MNLTPVPQNTAITDNQHSKIQKVLHATLFNGVWLTHSDINKVKVISELLCIRHSYVTLECFNSEDIDFYDRVHVYWLGLAHSLYVCFYFRSILFYLFLILFLILFVCVYFVRYSFS